MEGPFSILVAGFVLAAGCALKGYWSGKAG
jgi:hypothetical protein